MKENKDFEEIARENTEREREGRIGKPVKDEVERLVVDALCRYPNYSAKQIGQKVGVTPTMVNEVKAKYAAEIAARTGHRVRTERKKEAENLWLTDEEKAAHITLDDALQSVQKETSEVIGDPLSPRQFAERTVQAEAYDGGVKTVIVDEKKDEAPEKAVEIVKAGDDPSSVSLRSTASPLGSQGGYDTSSVGSADTPPPSRGSTLLTPFEAFWKGRAFCLLDVIRACIENGDPVKHKHIHELDMICEMLALTEDNEDEV